MGKKRKEFVIGDLVRYKGKLDRPEFAVIKGIFSRTIPVKYNLYELIWLSDDNVDPTAIQGVFLEKVEKKT